MSGYPLPQHERPPWASTAQAWRWSAATALNAAPVDEGRVIPPKQRMAESSSETTPQRKSWPRGNTKCCEAAANRSEGRLMPTPPTMTPKALIHQKYGAKASYRVEEVREAVDGGCPGLMVPQQARSVYRCSLDLPGLTVVTPGTFVRKKDAEQAAAQIAVDKLGIQPTAIAPSTPAEAWDELIARISCFFTDEVSVILFHLGVVSS
ncbi:hypothetical protein GUJ93_ZPchr0016g2584 [Zizania palustris]|uniref:dsRNA binding domain-containing protein n=1 Tax=Zizania palustris TaxID=103762 RepID=A0A8J5TBC8_ZIZPA|nr:hypothetical protein GUJ93_ZPchr0016g2584 [Zizania palustris]